MLKKITLYIYTVLILLSISFTIPLKASVSQIQIGIDDTRNTIIYFTFNPRFLNQSLSNSGSLITFGTETNTILRYENTDGNIWRMYDINSVVVGSGNSSQLNKNLFALVLKNTAPGTWQYSICSWNNANGIFAWSELTNTFFGTIENVNDVYFSPLCSIFAVDYYDTGASMLDFVIYHWQNVINDGNNGLGNLVLSQGAWEEAYSAGYSAGFGAQGSFLQGVWNAIDGFLSIQILPNISIGLIVSVPIAFGLISLILQFWRKD